MSNPVNRLSHSQNIDPTTLMGTDKKTNTMDDLCRVATKILEGEDETTGERKHRKWTVGEQIEIFKFVEEKINNEGYVDEWITLAEKIPGTNPDLLRKYHATLLRSARKKQFSDEEIDALTKITDPCKAAFEELKNSFSKPLGNYIAKYFLVNTNDQKAKKRYWADEEIEKLAGHLEDAREKGVPPDWSAISIDLKRTERGCQLKAAELSVIQIQSVDTYKPISFEESVEIFNYASEVAQLPPSASKWTEMRRKFPNRKYSSILSHYYITIERIKKINWSDDKNPILLNSVQQNSGNWDKISEELGIPRIECLVRHHILMGNMITRKVTLRKWTDNETNLLKEFVKNNRTSSRRVNWQGVEAYVGRRQSECIGKYAHLKTSEKPIDTHLGQQLAAAPMIIGGKRTFSDFTDNNDDDDC